MKISGDFSFDQKCGKFFTYRDFIECSDTFKSTACLNMPQQVETITAMQNLATELLDKVYEKFGQVQLTYGFCSQALGKLIPKNRWAAGDQHAGHELNQNGRFICERLGFATDFLVPKVSSGSVARFIVSDLSFDRLYYYGEDKPIHVSLSDTPTRAIVLMRTHGERRIPKNISEFDFLNNAVQF